MNTRTTLLIGVFIGMLTLITLMFIPYKGQAELIEKLDAVPSPQVQSQPNYGTLTEPQQRIADTAIQELLNTTPEIAPGDISVTSFEEKQFSDSSLGCPEEGKMYAQAITDGFQIIFQVNDKAYDYRLNSDLSVVKRCQQNP